MVGGLLGASPREPRSTPGFAVLTTTMPREGDPRGRPASAVRRRIDLSALRVVGRSAAL